MIRYVPCQALATMFRLMPEDLPTLPRVEFDCQLNYTSRMLMLFRESILWCQCYQGSRRWMSPALMIQEHYLVTLFMLLEALVLSIIDYALPMIKLSMNQVNRVEKLQNS